MGKVEFGFALCLLICLLPTTFSAPTTNDFIYRMRINATNPELQSFSSYPIEVNISTSGMQQNGIDLSVFCGGSLVSDYAVRKHNSTDYGVRFKVVMGASSFNDTCYIYYGSSASLSNLSLAWMPAAWNLYYNFTEMSNESLDDIAAGYSNWSIQPSTAKGELEGQNSIVSSDSISLFTFKDILHDGYSWVRAYMTNTSPVGCGIGDYTCMGLMVDKANTTDVNNLNVRTNEVGYILFSMAGNSQIIGVNKGGLLSKLTLFPNAWQKIDVKSVICGDECGEPDIFGYDVGISYLNGNFTTGWGRGALEYALWVFSSETPYVALSPVVGAEYHAVMYREYGEGVIVSQGIEEELTPPTPEVPTYEPQFDGVDVVSASIDTVAGLLIGFAQPAESIGSILAISMFVTLALVGISMIVYGIFTTIPK